MHGSPLLEGSNRVPGCHLTEEEKKLFLTTLGACKDYGLVCYPTIIQKVKYDEMSELAAYGGFPVRYPHWKWGMEYEELQKGYEYNQHRIFEMVINCLCPDTPVLTNRGTIKAIDVNVGDQVVIGHETRKVFAVNRQKKSLSSKIIIKGYGKPLVCTAEHKWKILSEDGLIWKETKDIVSGDIICGEDNYFGYRDKPCKINWKKDDCVNETRINIRRCLKEIIPPNLMTLDLAELLGALTGDGSIGVISQENALYVTVDKKLGKYVDHISSLFLRVFGNEPAVYEKDAAFIVQLNSKLAVDFVDYLGLTKGCTYKSKRVPAAIWQSSQEFRAAYLRGLFDTDGYASDTLGVSGYNIDLICDVQLMLMEMGIFSKVDANVPNGIGKDGGQKFINILTIQGQPSLRKFQQRVGFYIDYKVKGLERLISVVYCRGGGLVIPYLQKLLMEWGERQGFKSTHSLARSLWSMKRSEFGFNALFSFIERALKLYGYDKLPQEVLDLVNTKVYYEVERVDDYEEMETVDIALDHDSHDFIANGFISHNTNPCVIYLLASNTLLDNITVVAHATGHNHFFKNNIFFMPTDVNMMNKLANHGSRIRRYMNRWGRERVIEFIDHILRIQTLTDPAKAWEERVVEDPIIRDTRTYEFPQRVSVGKDRLHMDPWMNRPEYIKKEHERIDKLEVARELNIFTDPDKDVFGYIKNNANFKPWQADIISMLYEEAQYFAPQRMTKTTNEGFASYIDYEIMTRQGYVSLGQKTHDAGIIEYSIHKMQVLGGKYSMNPYKLGFYLLLDIEERWNKGQFGEKWEECKNPKERENWDLKLGLGKDKVFEVVKYYDDVTFISEFFTQEFCDKFEFFEWRHYPNGEWKIESRDASKIRKRLIQKYINGGLPDIRLVDPNYRNKGWLLLQHYYDDRLLYEPYIKAVLPSIYYLWGKEVVLGTRNKNGEEVIMLCWGPNSESMSTHSREEFENKY
jgi:stage V sporulation protein R